MRTPYQLAWNLVETVTFVSAICTLVIFFGILIDNLVVIVLAFALQCGIPLALFIHVAREIRDEKKTRTR